MYSKTKEYIENITDYFPEYEEKYIHPSKYFEDLFSILKYEIAERFIDHFNKERN